MRYFKVAMQSAADGIIYQRDFQTDKIFRKLIYSYVSSLVRANDLIERSPVVIGDLHGIGIRESDLYKTFIVPHYGPFRRLSSTPPIPDDETVEHSPWTSVFYEELPRPDEPVTFFSIYVVIPSRSLWYCSNFKSDDLIEFWSTIRSSLYTLKVLQRGEKYEGVLYARDDDKANFERDELFVTPAQEETPLIEVLPTHASEPLFATRSLNDFQVQVTRTIEPGRPPNRPEPEQKQTPTSQILVTRAVMEQLRTMACTGVPAEQGGVLVGEVYQNSDDGGYLVVITDHIQSEDTSASRVEFKYTFTSWQKQITTLQERFPDKRIVGWYHTHLIKQEVKIPDRARSLYLTPFFLSRDDLFTHRQFFRNKWYVALVLDTTGNGMFFHWQGDEIIAQPEYYLVELTDDAQLQVAESEE